MFSKATSNKICLPILRQAGDNSNKIIVINPVPNYSTQEHLDFIKDLVRNLQPDSQRSPLSWCPSGTRTPASLQLVPASQQLRQKSQQNTSKGSENQFWMFNDVFFNQKFRKTSSVSIFLTSKQKNVKKLEIFFFRFFSIFFSSKGPPLVN